MNQVLLEMVPKDINSYEQPSEVMRSSVRKFFQRADADYKGFVSEERFRAFLRSVAGVFIYE